jgi:hypothetical protein
MMQPVVLTHPSSALTLHDLYNDVTCTIRHHAFTIFEINCETLVRLAFRRSKPLDLDVYLAPSSSRRFCGATNKL